ncbi:hypothetical protein V5799_000384 [Amblyomma americanum]|uniref:M13 family peptidase n=1 Tax=Amblyomma americanum TaxID=6943 RepID=A0AAQ4D376_AMBAM
MNSEVQPCSNFYSFVCGSWKPIAGESSMIERIFAVTRKVVMQELQADPKGAPVPLAPQYFQSCVAALPDDLVKGEVEKFKRFKKDLGLTWPEEWPERSKVNMPPLKILLNLSVNWNINLMFKVDVMPAYHGRPKALRISRGDWNAMRKNRTDEQFAALVMEHTGYLGVPSPSGITELNKYTQTIINATVTFTADASYEDRRTLKDVDQDMKSEGDRWSGHLNEIYSPQYTWKQDDIVLIQHPDILTRLQHLQEKLPEASLRMGLSWVLIRLFLWRVIAKPELWTKADATTLQTITKLTCLTHLENTFGLVVSAKHIHERFTKLLRHNLNSFFEEIRDQIKHDFANASWIDDLAKKKTYAKLENIWKNMLPDDRFFSTSSLAALYKNFPAVGKSFMDNFINMAKAFRRTMDKDDFITIFSRKLGSGHAVSRYSYFYNQVSIEVGALEPPLLYSDGSFAMMYGSLGTILAAAMVRAFDARGVLYNEKGEEEQWWTQGREEFDKRVKCNLGVASSTASSPQGSSSQGHVSPLASLVLAVRISFHAYRAAIRKEGIVDVFPLKGLDDYVDDQVFFMTYCLMTCATDSNGDPCNVPMRHSHKFAATFGCSSGDAMNPEEKCSFF